MGEEREQRKKGRGNIKTEEEKKYDRTFCIYKVDATSVSYGGKFVSTLDEKETSLPKRWFERIGAKSTFRGGDSIDQTDGLFVSDVRRTEMTECGDKRKRAIVE